MVDVDDDEALRRERMMVEALFCRVVELEEGEIVKRRRSRALRWFMALLVLTISRSCTRNNCSAFIMHRF